MPGGAAVMIPKDLIVFVEELEGRDQRLAFAAALAERWSAHLIATFVVDRLELDPHAGFATGSGLAGMLEHHDLEVAEAMQQARQAFERELEHRRISGEWRVSDGEVGEALMLHARHAALAVIGPSKPNPRHATTLGLSRDLIFASGRPTLLLPIDWPVERSARRIVVGWNASREATRAIADAMAFLVGATQVHLVVVPEANGGSYGHEPGADMARHLVRHGVPVVLEQCEGADAGAVLLERCRALDADLLVMGAVGRSRISEFVFGGATHSVLERAALPLLLSR
jgi:nucleotide-binding universal stress UspA family protein